MTITNLNKFIFSVFISLTIFCFIQPTQVFASSLDNAIFAGGCFWCLEHDLESLNGVINVDSGYTGGDLVNPTYKNHQGHQESVFVTFDPMKINYNSLLRSYWRNVDPLDEEGQFCDKGDSYRPIIFFNSSSQETMALDSLDKAVKELGQEPPNIKVQVLPSMRFWLAEDYHQDFAERNSIKYNFYRYSCGRDKRLDEIWGPSARTDDEWKQ